MKKENDTHDPLLTLKELDNAINYIEKQNDSLNQKNLQLQHF